MQQESEVRDYSSTSISKMFVVENQLLSSASADAYKSVLKESSTPCCLWLVRERYAPDSKEAQEFLGRLQSLSDAQLSFCKILSFGMDQEGVLFAAIPRLDGVPLGAPTRDHFERERRFESILRVVDELHALGMAIGDIGPHSFWIDRDGELLFIGVCGIPGGVFTASNVSQDVLPYLAPEVRDGHPISLASDVYSLGVLCYFIFANALPFETSDLEQQGALRPLGSLVTTPPAWADGVLPPTLVMDPSQRLQTAGDLIDTIVEVRRRIYSEDELPAERGSRAVQKPQQPSKTFMAPQPAKEQTDSQEETADTEDPKNAAKKQSDKNRFLIISGIFLALMLTAFLLWVVISSITGKRVRTSTAAQTSALTDRADLSESLDALSRSSNEEDRAVQLQRLVASDDPLAHEVLVRSALEAKTPERRVLSENSIIERARRLGLPRSAEQGRLWLRTVSTPLPQNYEAMLKSLDTTLPKEARDVFLRESYAANPSWTLRMASAMALDAEVVSDFQVILGQLLGDALKLHDEAIKHSPLALIMAQPELAGLFGDDLVQRREEIPNDDVFWLIKILAERNDFNLRAFASLAAGREMVSPLRQRFLLLIRDRDDLPVDIMNALTRASVGDLREEDIGSFGRWFDLESGKVLLNLCADLQDERLLTGAFDVLAGKSLNNRSLTGLIEWVRRNRWEKRAIFAKSIGLIGSAEFVTPEQLTEAVVAFEAAAREPELLGMLIALQNTVIARQMIERFGSQIDLGGLLQLLGSQDPAVRIAAIKALARYNDVGALKLIKDQYQSEKDETVRSAYRESFWMLK